MARVNVSNDPMVISLFNSRGGLLKGIRRSGKMVERAGAGHSIRGTVRAGLSASAVREIWSRKHADVLAAGGRIEIGLGVLADRPIVSEEVAAKKAAQKAARAEKRAAKEAREREAESKLLAGSPDPMAPLAVSEELLAAYADLARRNATVFDGRLKYVITVARFHGGASSAWLGNILSAGYALPKDYPFRGTLDAIADMVATRAFGSNVRAARVWASALGYSR